MPPQPIPISNDDISEGAKDAPLAIVEYSDFECPFCGQFSRDYLPRLRKEYIQTGQVQLIFKAFPLMTIHQHALMAARASYCSASLGKFWPMHDLLFENQKRLDFDNLLSYSRMLGLPTEQFQACLSGPSSDKLRRDLGSGYDLLITSTPTFLVGASDGTAIRVTSAFAGVTDVTRLFDEIHRRVKTH